MNKKIIMIPAYTMLLSGIMIAPATAAQSVENRFDVQNSSASQQQESTRTTRTETRAVKMTQDAAVSKVSAYSKPITCSQALKVAKPSWFSPAQWTINCVKGDPQKMVIEYNAGTRQVNVNTNMSQQTLPEAFKWVFKNIPTKYRNAPVKDCNRIVSKYKPMLNSSVKGWKISCTSNKLSINDKGISKGSVILGLTTYNNKTIRIYSTKRTYTDLEETITHEIGHAVSSTWSVADVKNWGRMTNTIWDNPVYSKRGTESWAESYASYILKRKIPYPVATVFSSAAVTSQLKYAKTH